MARALREELAADRTQPERSAIGAVWVGLDVLARLSYYSVQAETSSQMKLY